MSNDVTNRFSEWLNSLEPNQIEAISSSILKQEGDFNLTDFYENSAIFSSSQKVAFTELMATHQIEFLGGNNSKNFKVINPETGDIAVLKLETRFNNPREQEIKLRELDSLKGTFIDVPAIKEAKLGDDAYFLQINEYCTGSDLIQFKQNNCVFPPETLEQANAIYTQMANVLLIMEEQHIVHADMKNSNWLLDSSTQKIRIADTKMLLPTEENGLFNSDSVNERGYDLFTDEATNPPEFISLVSEKDADKVHAYILGKNIYEFLACHDGGIGQGRVNAHDYLTQNSTANTFDFSDPAFQNPIGFRYRLLIFNLVTEKPELRMSVSDATQSLAAIDSLQKNPQLLDRFYLLGNENFQINNQYNRLGLQAPPITSIDIGARINDPKLTASELQTLITTIEAHNQNLISDLNNLNNRQAANYSSFREQFANVRPSDNAPVNEETQKNDLSS